MKHDHGIFSNNKGQSIYYQVWSPGGKVKAAVYLVHGLHEHSGRYHHLASYLVEHDYAVYGLDLPGHGKSDGVRSYVDNFQDLIHPVKTYMDMIKSWQPGLPVFLVGHSMGGLVAAAYLTKYHNQINGAVISAPLVKVPDYVTPLTIQIGKVLARILPKITIVGIDKQGLCRDPDVVQDYIDDPLVINEKMTARIANEINVGIDLIENHGSKITTPVLLLHGGDDRICDPSWSQYVYDLVSSPDKKLIIYKGLYHEIFNEPEAETVITDVINWLEKRIS
jgi:alpha-beta hydrolase superfamily lysophospholipase